MILKKQRNIELYSIKYFENLNLIFKKINTKKLAKLAGKLEKCRKQNAKIFVIGNGGSAINASAMANDLGFDILKNKKKNHLILFHYQTIMLYRLQFQMILDLIIYSCLKFKCITKKMIL